MKKSVVIFFILAAFGCFGQNKKKVASTPFQSIKTDTLLSDNISIRAILVDENKVWYAGNNGKFGFINLEDNQKTENKITNGDLKIEFRSIASTAEAIFILSVANPALLYKISKDGKTVKLVYEEYHDKVFYDSMQFWNETEGIAVGDPIVGCFSVLITKDGGNSWHKLPADKLPKNQDGEAAFAASNTNIVVKGNHTWIVSGGKKSRVFYSHDKGNTWQVYETPIVQGLEMTGIFTADFYNDQIGFVAGGDYEVPQQNFQNKAHTTDGGKTWQLIAQKQGFGIASCVQYVPGSKGKELVCVGGTGLFYSSDSGASWKQLSTDNSLYTLRFVDDHTAIAAGSKKIIRIEFKE